MNKEITNLLGILYSNNYEDIPKKPQIIDIFSAYAIAYGLRSVIANNIVDLSRGYNLWIMPPRNCNYAEWLDKCSSRARLQRNTFVGIIPARTDTEWWHDYCQDANITFINGRIKLYDDADPMACAIIEFKPGGISQIEHGTSYYDHNYFDTDEFSTFAHQYYCGSDKTLKFNPYHDVLNRKYFNISCKYDCLKSN